MKITKLLPIAISLMLFASCSDDDSEVGEVPNITPQDFLINNSPWNYSESRLGTVRINEIGYTNEELIQISDGFQEITTIDFTSETSVTITSPNLQFTGSWTGAEGDIVINFEGQSYRLPNYEVDNNEFTYELENEEMNSENQYSSWTSISVFN